MPGVVIFDGKPLEGARVTFQPRATKDALLAGQPSSGETDSEGRYALETYDGLTGAVVGTHRVSISTFRKKVSDDVGVEAKLQILSEEKIPPQYNSRSTLTREVTAKEENVIDFDLKQKRS